MAASLLATENGQSLFVGLMSTDPCLGKNILLSQMRFPTRVHSSKFPDGPEGVLARGHHVCKRLSAGRRQGVSAGGHRLCKKLSVGGGRTGGSTMGDSTVGLTADDPPWAAACDLEEWQQAAASCGAYVTRGGQHVPAGA